MSDQLTVFLDSNILFSACYRSPNLFERLWTIPHIRLVTAAYCIQEVRRNLTSSGQQARLDNWLLQTVEVKDCPADGLPTHLMLPAKDVPVLAAAALCNADILVTGDANHFARYFGHRVLGVLIESTGMFRSRYPEIFQD
ncbi:MAG: PIN domain-containing protein [Acidobacteriota bacterium]